MLETNAQHRLRKTLISQFFNAGHEDAAVTFRDEQ